MTTLVPRLLHYDLGAEVTAFSTCREGGCSEGSYASFNVNEWCGDSPEHVRRNREALCHCLKLPSERLIIPHQTHQANVRLVDEAFLAPENAGRRADWLEGIDALVTQLPNVCIGISTADCIPILLYEPFTHTVAAIHAGWRGTVARIVEHTLVFMVERLGAQPEKVRAVIGPGISQAAFEVGEEVYEAFSSARFPMAQIAARHSETKKWHINLPASNRLQLIHCGLRAENIYSTGICTVARSECFFSARRQGISSGRIFNGVFLGVGGRF